MSIYIYKKKKMNQQEEQKVNYKNGDTNTIVFGIFSKIEDLVANNSINENDYLEISNGLKTIRDNDTFTKAECRNLAGSLFQERQLRLYHQRQNETPNAYDTIMNDINQLQNNNNMERCSYCGTISSAITDKHYNSKKCLSVRIFNNEKENIKIKPLINACIINNNTSVNLLSNKLDCIMFKKIAQQKKNKKPIQNWKKIITKVEKYNYNWIIRNKLYKVEETKKTTWILKIKK